MEDRAWMCCLTAKENRESGDVRTAVVSEVLYIYIFVLLSVFYLKAKVGNACCNFQSEVRSTAQVTHNASVSTVPEIFSI